MKHPETERVIERFAPNAGYTYEPAIPLDSLNITNVVKQNIRPNGLDEDKVEQYAEAMKNGDEFPAITVYPTKKGYEVLGGMHRIEAAKRASLPAFDAYVVDLQEDERTVELLQRVLNMYHGSGYSKEERAMHGVRFVQAHGFSVEDAAKIVMVSVSMIKARVEAQEARRRAAEAGVPFIKSDTGIIELARIRNDELFKAAAKIASTARLTTAQIGEMSRQIREQSSEKAAQKVVETWQTNFAGAVKAGKDYTRTPSTPGRRAVEALVRIERIVTNEAFNGMTTAERDRAVTQLKSTILWLQGTLTSLLSSSRKRA